jgi:S-adenosyl methyltransferase
MECSVTVLTTVREPLSLSVGPRGAGALIENRNTFAVASRYSLTKDLVRVVFVDHDAVTVESGRTSYGDRQQVRYIHGDLREVDKLMQKPEVAQLLARTEPVAVLLFTVPHYLTDKDNPARILQVLRDAVSSGNVVVLSHCVSGQDRHGRQAVVDAGFEQATPLVLRTKAEVEGLAAIWGTPEPAVYVGQWGVTEERGRTAARWVVTTSATKP